MSSMHVQHLADAPVLDFPSFHATFLYTVGSTYVHLCVRLQRMLDSNACLYLLAFPKSPS